MTIAAAPSAIAAVAVCVATAAIFAGVMAWDHVHERKRAAKDVSTAAVSVASAPRR